MTSTIKLCAAAVRVEGERSEHVIVLQNLMYVREETAVTATIRNELYRVNFRGSLPLGEQFEHGIWATADTGVTDLEVAAAWTDGLDAFLAAASATAPPTMKQVWTAGVVWTSINVRHYNPATGLPLAPSTSVAYVGGAGTASDNLLPSQVAEVATFWNGITVGRHRYNRTYLPPTRMQIITVDGAMSPTLPVDIGAAFEAMDAAAGANVNPSGINVYSGSIHVVTGAITCRVDQVYDTQRRRDNGLVRTFTDTALP